MLLYGVIKFLAYCLWCFLGLRVVSPFLATLGRAIGFGVIRWLLGLVFGVVVFLSVGQTERANLLSLYVAIYLPLRVIEWGIITFLLRHTAAKQEVSISGRWVIGWIIGGIVVSFLTDMISPEGLAGRFCVGRCLC